MQREALVALRDSGIETLVCRQEGGAAYMAEAAGKITAKTGWIQSGYTLAGFMQTPDGGNLLFTLYNLGKVTEANREAMDDLAMGIYNCGTQLGNQ